MKSLITFLFAGMIVFAADPAWSRALNGLQLGIELDSLTEPTFRITLRNASSSVKSIRLGVEATNPPLYGIGFQAKRLDGKLIQVFDLAALKMTPVGGLVVPRIVTIQPGAAILMNYPLKQLEGLPPLKELHSLIVTFESESRIDEMGKEPRRDLWSGRISAELVLSE